MTVRVQPFSNVVERPGRVQGFRTVEVRARVDGIIQRRLGPSKSLSEGLLSAKGGAFPGSLPKDKVRLSNILTGWRAKLDENKYFVYAVVLG